VVKQNGVESNVPRNVGTGSWTLSDDAATVTLEGQLCDDALAGAFETLELKFGCVELPPLPPLMGPS